MSDVLDDQDGVQPVMADEITPQWQGFLDLTDVKQTLQIDPGVDTYDIQLQAVLDASCWWVQDYLGRPIAPTTFVRKFSGYSGLRGAFINLPYYPVLQMNSIVETWGMNGQHTLIYQTAASQGGPGQEMYQMDWIRGTVIRAYQGLIERPTFPGLQNIEVSWVAGYNPIPATVMMAAKELAVYWWRNTQESPRWQQDVNGQYDDSQAPGGLWPGVPNRITLLLQPFVQIGIG